ncbi:DUF1120 domain-containing protein [Pseudomonas sp. B21-032]|uniref:DUF1120 domain-containing protein n=1 Tax=Pseudomonas sp. B21-032 TaxID=2895483 RepID=UPI00215FABD3|nr:DUF1120 domain-containing protein [Pseudomonas sp. B21-032]UVL62790.1 DUF1120 domain-containing protein [Pseudomonas sp. B21-032]
MRLPPLVLLSVLLVPAPVVLATPAIEITVSGTITPAACRPAFSNQGKIDFGTIAFRELNEDSHTTLEEQTMTLTVECDSATRFGLLAHDNRRGSSTAVNFFGLGRSDNKKIGHYQLTVDPHDAQVDGEPGYVTRGLSGGVLWERSSAGSYDLGTGAHYIGFSASPGHTNGPDALTEVRTDIRLSAQVAPSRDLPATEDIALDGAVSFEVRYL